jgi:hypothetical protein
MPEDIRNRHRSSVFWAQLAVFSALMLLVAGWREWDLVDWISGRSTKDVSIIAPASILLVVSIVLSLLFFRAERGRR